MKHRILAWTFSFCIAALIFGCQSQNNSTPKTDRQNQTEPLPDLDAAQNGTSATIEAQEKSFEEQVSQWIADIFPEFKRSAGDPMDAYPKYKTAKNSLFATLRRNNPISNDFGKAVYMRILLKAYRFGNEKDQRSEVEAWLNGMNSATANIVLGQSVKDLKSPLSLCALVGDDFIVAQSGCVYAGPDWDKTEAGFFETMKAAGASYTFKIGCSGEISYLIKGQN